MRLIFLAIIFSVFFSGCYQAPVANQDISGVFTGGNLGKTETLIFYTNRVFSHSVFVDLASIHNSKGTYLITPTGVVLDEFDEFFDPMSGAYKIDSQKLIDYPLTFLRGPPFDILKSIPDGKHFLKKVSGS